MKVLHVISSVKREGGGPARSVQGLVAAECRLGIDAGIFTFHQGDTPWVDGISCLHSGAEVDYELQTFEPDIVHIHGIWNYDLHRAAVICRRWGIPYVVAPRGMLEPWSLKQKWLKKRIARFVYQDRDIKGAAALHATAKSEAEQFRRLGFTNPIIVSPNGVNVPNSFERKGHTGQTRRALFVSRLHPKKGVLELVETWPKCKLDGWVCELVYTLRSEVEKEYEAKIKARVRELGLDDAFVFTGQLDDDAKWEAYARTDLFVLPTYSENFGIVVAEALWAGVPVITTKGTPWSDLTSEKCGWWIDLPDKGAAVDSTWKSLKEALDEAASMSEPELEIMGQRGKMLVDTKYSWGAVCDAMLKGYEEIVNAKADR